MWFVWICGLGVLATFTTSQPTAQAEEKTDCLNGVNQKIAAAEAGGRAYQPAVSVAGTSATLTIAPTYSQGFRHPFWRDRTPTVMSIPLRSSNPLPVKSPELVVKLAGSLQRTDGGATINQQDFAGAGTIGIDGKTVDLATCVDPRGVPPGEYTGTILVSAAQGVEELSVPVDITLQATDWWLPVIPFVALLVGLFLKILTDVEKLVENVEVGKPAKPLRPAMRNYISNHPVRFIGTIVTGIIAMSVIFWKTYASNPTFGGDHNDGWVLFGTVVAAQLTVNTIADALGLAARSVTPSAPPAP